jgi:hypothetical protein
MRNYQYKLESTPNGSSQNGTSYDMQISLSPANSSRDPGQEAATDVTVGIIHYYHDGATWLEPKPDLYKIPDEEHDGVMQQAAKERDEQYHAMPE